MLYVRLEHLIESLSIRYVRIWAWCHGGEPTQEVNGFERNIKYSTTVLLLYFCLSVCLFSLVKGYKYILFPGGKTTIKSCQSN